MAHTPAATSGSAPRSRARLWPLGRRGVTSIVFGVSAAVLLGAGALATEAGLWYLSLRNARTAADASAMAAAAARSNHGAARVDPTARAVATANGFTHSGATTVTVNNPPTSGAYAGNTAAVEVLITRAQNVWMARLVSNATPIARVRAVAARLNLGDACVLALDPLGQGLEIGGNSTTIAPGCILTSNKTGSDSVRIFGSATVTAESLQAVGECDGCGGGGGSSVTLTEPFRPFSPPTPNPFAAVDALPMPTAWNQVNLPDFSSTNRTQTIAPSILPSATSIPATNVTAYSGNNNTISLTNGDTLNLQPGIYYFHDTTLRVNGGTVQCPDCVPGVSGVTLIFTGSNPATVGTIDFQGNGTVDLSAHPTMGVAELRGILMYQDDLAVAGSLTRINGTNTSRINGALYFPSANLSYNGTMVAGPGRCQMIVARSVSLSGNSSTALDNSGCASYGTQLTMASIIRLVE